MAEQIAQYPHTRLCRYIDLLMEELCGIAPQALKRWDEEAIHDARVLTRRLTATLDLLKPAAPRDYLRRLAKALRTLRRWLGPLRDLDVMLGHLQESRFQTRHATAVAWIVEQLDRERQVLRNRLLGKSPAVRILSRLGSWWALRQQIMDGPADLDSLLSQSLPEQLDSFAQQATGLRRPLGAPNHTEGDDPHALRIAGKRLRYTLEIAAEIGRQLPGPIFEQFKQMQKALGLWHDHLVLSQKVLRLALDDELACHNRMLYQQLVALSGAAWRHAEHHLVRFSTIWLKEGQSVKEAIGQSCPLHDHAEPELTDEELNEFSARRSPDKPAGDPIAAPRSPAPAASGSISAPEPELPAPQLVARLLAPARAEALAPRPRSRAGISRRTMP